MSVFSEVVVIMTKELDKQLKEKMSKEVNELLAEADFVYYSGQGVRYQWTMTVWEEDYDDSVSCQLHQLLYELNEGEDQFSIWKLTAEHIWNGFNPLEKFGSYRNSDLDPCITVEFEIPNKEISNATAHHV